jgi:hypothetical protein
VSEEREHATTGAHCWCGPKITRRCTELCDGGCWRCDDGWMECSADEAEGDWDDEAYVVVHNREAVQ